MLEYLQCLHRPDLRFLGNSLFLIVALSSFVLCPKFKTSLANLWLRIATSTMACLATFFLCNRIVSVFGSVSLTNVLLLAETPDEFEALLAVANSVGISQLLRLTARVLVLCDQILYWCFQTYVDCFNLSTIMADCLQELLDLSEETCMRVNANLQRRLAKPYHNDTQVLPV